MIPEFTPFFVTATAAVFCGVYFMVATRRSELLAGTVVHPFAPSVNPAEDTLAEQAMVSTILADRNDWNLVTLSSLRDVEDLLDSLEMGGVAHREVHTFGNSTFAVRWK